MLAIIGGRGLTELENLKITHRQVMRTPYGEPSGPFLFGTLNGHEVIFLARHGFGYTIPPHLVNYRANLWALHDAGVSDVVSVSTVGGICKDLLPGTLAVPDQIIDYTYGRDYTFFCSRNVSYRNIDFTHPYSERLRSRILQAAQMAGQHCLDGGTYATTQGPRLDSTAEINRYEKDGADMVGMTGMPEAALARELEIHYASIAVVANYAAGRGDSLHEINVEGVNATALAAMDRVRAILEYVVNCEGEEGDGD